MEKINQLLQDILQVHKNLLNYEEILGQISDVIITCLKHNHKVLLCGNGGSAADCQHIAGDFINRFNYDRDSLPAIALTTDTSILTCISNDSSFNYVFSKQIDALGQEGDVLIAISTSGNSGNILEAISSAKQKKLLVVGFTGKSGGKMKNLCNLLFAAPSEQTPRIQECHIAGAHIICDVVESEMFPK